ncbi:MAG: hypothetical protein EBZ75_02210 [Oxalobacteraceae bacterium]|nr:hypothetical protein [Oxalobacteraceae bacterium]
MFLSKRKSLRGKRAETLQKQRGPVIPATTTVQRETNTASEKNLPEKIRHKSFAPLSGVPRIDVIGFSARHIGAL